MAGACGLPCCALHRPTRHFRSTYARCVRLSLRLPLTCYWVAGVNGQGKNMPAPSGRVLELYLTEPAASFLLQEAGWRARHKYPVQERVLTYLPV